MSHRLQVKDQQGEREVLLIDSLAVGRDPRCDISAADPLLSRRHAEFLVSGAQVLVRDLNSRNGILVNGHRTPSAVLRPGDVVQIAQVVVTFVASIEPATLKVAPPAGPVEDHTTLLSARQMEEAAAASAPGFVRSVEASTAGDGNRRSAGWSVKVTAADDRTSKVAPSRPPAGEVAASVRPLPATIASAAILPDMTPARHPGAPAAQPAFGTLAARALSVAVVCFGLGVMSTVVWQRDHSPLIVIAAFLLVLALGTIAALAGRKA